MSKILNWIKKHVWQAILIVFGLFFLPLIIVHTAYRIPAITPWFASDWESGELITYIAGFEAFFASVAIGIIALKNSEKAVEVTQNGNGISERLLALEERQEKIERVPYIYLRKVSFLGYNTLSDFPSLIPGFADATDLNCPETIYLNIKLTITNVSKICTYIHFYQFAIDEKNPRRFIYSTQLDLKTIMITPGDSFDFNVFFKPTLFQKGTDLLCYITIDTTNHFREMYRQFLFFVASQDTNENIKVFLDSHNIIPWEHYD